jgi:hypothetical protein
MKLSLPLPLLLPLPMPLPLLLPLLMPLLSLLLLPLPLPLPPLLLLLWLLPLPEEEATLAVAATIGSLMLLLSTMLSIQTKPPVQPSSSVMVVGQVRGKRDS